MILSLQRNAWTSCAVDSAGLLVDADDYYEHFYHAALRAERSILLCGWQFDSDVPLLRGTQAEGISMPLRLKNFLSALCEQKPALQIRVLSWDYHVVFSLEREWMQKAALHWTTHERVQFRFDQNHAPRGCHHQKFVVIDESLSYVGGMDLCQDRWDTRAHRDQEPLRTSRGKPHKPYHDVQAYLVGRGSARCLTELFKARWYGSGGDALDLPEPPKYEAKPWITERALRLPATQVTLSRTDPAGMPTSEHDCHEILTLHQDAIAAAQQSIYIETQYFSSHLVAEALGARLRAEGSALDIVIVTNKEAESAKEQAAVGLAQAKIIGELKAAAEGTHHHLGIYYTLPTTEPGAEASRATYIHSKLLIVDDRLLSVGSANLTNRSCGLDTELNASFESPRDGGEELAQAICAIRLDLLSEHTGRTVSREDSKVAALDSVAQAGGRLRIHPSPTEDERLMLDVVDPQKLPFDPCQPEEIDLSFFADMLEKLKKVVG